MAVLIERCAHGPWTGCVRLLTEVTEVRVLVEAGPRVLFLGEPGGTNLLYEAPRAAPRGPGGWRLIGGHRLWTAPEDPVRTYVRDDDPVDVETLDDGVILRGSVEEPTGLRKVLAVRMTGSAVHVRHTLEQVEGHSSRAPWAITAFAGGGRAWLPRVRRRAHPDALLPDQSLVLWPYTDLGDPRLVHGAVGITIDHDAEVSSPLKLGAVHPLGWLAWTRGRDVVVQHTVADDGVRPDLGATHEIFVDAHMTELEALGPVRTLRPGDTATLEQTWFHRRLPHPVDVVGLGRLVGELGLDPGRLGTG
jgi:hypothetical protein